MKHNTEDNIHTQFNQREIKPNPAAWDRLDAMLTVAEKPKRKFGWLYIAASLVGVLLVATVFLKNSTPMIDVAKDPQQNTFVFEETNDSVEVPKIELNEAVLSQKTNVVATINQPVFNSLVEKKEHTVLENTIENSNSTIVIKEEPVQTVERKSRISPEELLASVENNTSQNVIQPNQNSITVSSKSLLNHVDGEVELTFREKVIKTVSKNYQEVKVVISNRNQ